MTQAAVSPRMIQLGTTAGTVGPWSFVDTAGGQVYVEEESHVKVTRFASATAETGTEEAGVMFTGIPGDNVTVELSTALTDGERLVVERNSPVDQTLSIPAGNAFSLQSIEENGLDRIIRRLQDLKARLDWALTNATGIEAPAFVNSTNALPDGGPGYAYKNSDGSISYLTGTGDPGDSAYEIWLAQGNTGTATDFLNSLVGPEGPSGTAGLSSGAGYRENFDGTVSMSFSFAPLVAGVDTDIVLPVTLASGDYEPVLQVGDTTGATRIVNVVSRSANKMVVRAEDTVPNLFIQVEGGTL